MNRTGEWEKVPLKVGRVEIAEIQPVEDVSGKGQIRIEDIQSEVCFFVLTHLHLPPPDPAILQFYLPPSEWGALTEQYGSANPCVSILEDPRYRREQTPVHPRLVEIKELRRIHPSTVSVAAAFELNLTIFQLTQNMIVARD
jgi:hypothetical protein